MAKNKLADLEITVAAEIEKRRRHRRRYPQGGKTRIGKDVKARNRKPPPVPKNKSVKEIKEMDPHDRAFRDPIIPGRPRKWVGVDGDQLIDDEDLTWKDWIRRERQRKTNDRRASVRRYEATVIAAQRTLERHVEQGQAKKGLADEDRMIAEGILELDDWDNEELVRGYRRNRAGRFGAPPKYIPREVQQYAFRILVNRGDRRLKEAYYETIERLVDLAHNAESEKVRLEAVKELMNRVVGKVPDRMLVAREEPWEGILADSVVPISESAPLTMDIDEDGVARLPYVPALESGGGAPDSGGRHSSSTAPSSDNGQSSGGS